MNLIELFSTFIILYFKYTLFYYFLYLSGKTFDNLLDKLQITELEDRNKLLNIDKVYLYPILGVIFLGNFLIFLNFFLPLDNLFVYFLILLIPVISFKKIKFTINKINFHKIIYFVFIPSVLLISSYEINFHYDAAYYHLNHQNWLRESNLIIGMVNIFWPFGMSSVYEYISAILWFDDTFILIHFLSLLFIQFIFICFYFFIFESKNLLLKNSSLFIIIFGFLDNFGYGGGRNGFLYIQEAGKQDIAVASLSIFIIITLFNSIKKEHYNFKDLTLIFLISFFIFQIKVSAFYIFVLVIIYIFQILFIKKVNLRMIILNLYPVLILSVFWFTKSFLTTGCLIFPVSLSCSNKMSWYEVGSTKAIEEYTTQTSFAFVEYFKNNKFSFAEWFNDFFINNGGFSEYYRNFYSNFLISFFILLIFCLVSFKSQRNNLFFNISVLIFIVFGISYLVFYGPIPRYSIGFLTTIIGILGFYFSEPRFIISNKIYLFIFIFTVGLLPRLSAYKNTTTVNEIVIKVDYINQNQIIKQNMEWITPYKGDKCWIDLNCRIDEGSVELKEGLLFKTAFKNADKVSW